MSERQTYTDRVMDARRRAQAEEDSDREQCQMCLGYFDTDDTEQPIICKGCLDKAAAYDSTKLSLDVAMQTITNVLEKAETILKAVRESDRLAPDLKVQFDGWLTAAIGSLAFAEGYCKPSKKG